MIVSDANGNAIYDIEKAKNIVYYIRLKNEDRARKLGALNAKGEFHIRRDREKYLFEKLQARIKRFLKMKGLLEKDMIRFDNIVFAVDPASPDGDQSKEVTAIHYEDSEGNKKIKILSITTPQPGATQ